MKFPYRKEPSLPSRAQPERKSVLRPRIRIRLRNGSKFIDLLTLIDSGADDCLFPAEVAEVIDLAVPTDNAHVYTGIGEGRITAYFHPVTIEVGGWTYTLYAGFSPDPGVVPILGQSGFFDLFEIRFNRGKENIELKEAKK